MSEQQEDKGYTPPQIERDRDGRPIYRPDGKVLRGFMRSSARVRIIRGPIRSGTSSLCCMEIFRRACEQAPDQTGVRKSRWAVVRNTYPDLQQSTIKTWLSWFPEKDFGRMLNSKPMVHYMHKGDVRAEVVFLALDTAEDVSKLRSTEWTGIWFNEVEYIPKEIFDEAESRVGYYPALKDGGATWSGVFADMNAPTEDNWVVRMTGEVPPPEGTPEEDLGQYRWPDGWEYFVQPPGLVEIMAADGKTVAGYQMNAEAENLQWLPRINGKPLYIETIKGKTKRWIDSRIMNRITAPVEGQPVWPSFVIETHVAKADLRFQDGHALYMGADFGRRPAVVFGQLINNRWIILDELIGSDVGATTFVPRVRKFVQQRFGITPVRETVGGGGSILCFGDPKGADKTQADEVTAYDVYRDYGFNIRPAPVPSNAIDTRLEAVEYVLNGMSAGMPRFLLSPRCPTLKMAMAGGYCYRKGDVTRAEPVKNRYSDIADALQYMLLGAGEGRTMTGRSRGSMSQSGAVGESKWSRDARRSHDGARGPGVSSMRRGQ